MGIGVARYVRDNHDPSLAEVAVVMADEWQGRRVGTALLGRLGDRAYSAGVERLVGRLIVGTRLPAHSRPTLARRCERPAAPGPSS